MPDEEDRFPALPHRTEALVRSRVRQNIEWYKKHKRTTRRLHRSSTALVIVLGAAIPYLLSLDGRWPSVTAGAFGVLVAAVTGLSTSFRWEKNWTSFTRAQTTLEAQLTEWELRMIEAERLPQDDRDAAVAEATRRLMSSTSQVLRSEADEFFTSGQSAPATGELDS